MSPQQLYIHLAQVLKAQRLSDKYQAQACLFPPLTHIRFCQKNDSAVFTFHRIADISKEINELQQIKNLEVEEIKSKVLNEVADGFNLRTYTGKENYITTNELRRDIIKFYEHDAYSLTNIYLKNINSTLNLNLNLESVPKLSEHLNNWNYSKLQDPVTRNRDKIIEAIEKERDK